MGLYVALPDAREIQICLTSQGGLCVMNQALHPVETVEWCVYALFIQDKQRIKRDCSMNFKPRKANVAQSMGGYLWAVSSLVGEKMQVRCLTETHVEVIKPPLQVIHIGNGCEGYSPSIKIPAKSELMSQNDIAERTTYFLDFNAQYEKSKDMGPWNLFELDKFTEKKLKGMVDMLPALPPMNYDNLNRRIGELDDYPLEIPVAIIAIVLVVSTVFLVATLVVYAYIIFRLRKNIKILFPHGKIINRTSHWIRSTRNKENVTHPSRNPGWTTLPTTTSIETNQTRHNTCRDYISPDHFFNWSSSGSKGQNRTINNS